MRNRMMERAGGVRLCNGGAQGRLRILDCEWLAVPHMRFVVDSADSDSGAE
jgi:hypothetical protein